MVFKLQLSRTAQKSLDKLPSNSVKRYSLIWKSSRGTLIDRVLSRILCQSREVKPCTGCESESFAWSTKYLIWKKL